MPTTTLHRVKTSSVGGATAIAALAQMSVGSDCAPLPRGSQIALHLVAYTYCDKDDLRGGGEYYSTCPLLPDTLLGAALPCPVPVAGQGPHRAAQGQGVTWVAP